MEQRKEDDAEEIDLCAPSLPAVALVRLTPPDPPAAGADRGCGGDRTVLLQLMPLWCVLALTAAASVHASSRALLASPVQCTAAAGAGAFAVLAVLWRWRGAPPYVYSFSTAAEVQVLCRPWGSVRPLW